MIYNAHLLQRVTTSSPDSCQLDRSLQYTEASVISQLCKALVMSFAISLCVVVRAGQTSLLTSQGPFSDITDNIF